MSANLDVLRQALVHHGNSLVLLSDASSHGRTRLAFKSSIQHWVFALFHFNGWTLMIALLAQATAPAGSNLGYYAGIVAGYFFCVCGLPLALLVCVTAGMWKLF